MRNVEIKLATLQLTTITMKIPPPLQFTAIAKENNIPLNEMRTVRADVKTAQNMREVSATLYHSTLPAHVAKQVYVEIRKLNGLESKSKKKTKKVATLQEPLIEQVVGEYWLNYAERALRDDVYPSLFSSHPGQWINDACAQCVIPRPKAIDYRRVIDNTTKYIIQVLYKQPLRYLRTTQWMVTRAMSH